MLYGGIMRKQMLHPNGHLFTARVMLEPMYYAATTAPGVPA